MFEIGLSILALGISFFLAFLFWELAADSDNKILTALFSSFAVMSIFCAGISVFGCIGLLLGL